MTRATPAAEGDRAPRDWRRRGGLLLALVFLVAGGWFLLRQRQALAATIELEAIFLLPLVFAEATMLAARGLLTRELCRPFGVALRVGEAIALASWTTLGNYVAPLVGGAGMRAVYLKRRHGLAYAHFLSLHAGTYAIHFWVASFAGLAALWLLPEIPKPGRSLLTTLFIAALAGGSLMIASPRPVRWLGGMAGRRLRRVGEGAELLISSGRRPIVFLLLTINLLAMTLSLFSAFRLLGVPLSGLQAALTAAVTSFSVLLSITPASFGITESVIVFAAALVGVPSAIALTAAAIKRLASLAVTLIAAGATAIGGRSGTMREMAPRGPGDGEA